MGSSGPAPAAWAVLAASERPAGSRPVAVTTGPRTQRRVPSLCLQRLSGARPCCSHIRRSEPTLGSRGLPLTPSFHLTPSLVNGLLHISWLFTSIPVSEIRPRTPALRCESDLKLWPPEQLKEDVRLTSRGQPSPLPQADSGGPGRLCPPIAKHIARYLFMRWGCRSPSWPESRAWKTQQPPKVLVCMDGVSAARPAPRCFSPPRPRPTVPSPLCSAYLLCSPGRLLGVF